LEQPASANAAANELLAHDPELHAMLRTTVSPTMLQSGLKVNVIPNTAEAQIDVRRLPTETREEIEARFRKVINDPAIQISPEPGQEMSRGATDGSYLRQKGMAVYVAPLFEREGGESRAHGNDERISPENLAAGTELLWKIVIAAAAE
jgi:acetylornithine deacetylase/succinyl-diaminopimelate desuccinylase-like protein